MKLEDIKASKLYRTSSRKSELDSKLITSGINVLLEIQKPEQIDKKSIPNPVMDEYKKQYDEKKDNNNDVDGLTDESVVEPVSDGKLDFKSEDERNSSSVIPSIPSKISDSEYDKKEVIDSLEDNNTEGKLEDEEHSSLEPVKEATYIESTLESIDVTDNLDNECKDIKGYLNSQKDTQGVSRIREKENNELWLYYNDNINLNDVMGSVIEALNKPGYTYLEFNRLARSDNAMVFIVMDVDTNREKKSIEEVKNIAES